MEEKELILKLQGLKQIKPRENWVVFAKANILTSSPVSKSLSEKVFSLVSNLTFQNRLAYAFAVLVFVFAGLIGANNFLNKGTNLPQKSVAALIQSNSDIKMFQVSSENLAQAVKNNSDNIPLAVNEVKVAVKNLTNAIGKNPKLAKEVAVALKSSGTLASLEGGEELKEASDELYKAIDIQMIEDLEKTTLPESQQAILEQTKELYNQGKYFEALEKILLINS